MTARMLLNSSSLADSLSTTPCAPSWRAVTMSVLATEAVNRMVRARTARSRSSRNATSPVMRGIARSSSNTSGSSSATSLTASSPSFAAPTTRRSGLVSRSLINPSRKMGWSSAITIRIGMRDGNALSVDPMTRQWNSNFEAGPLAGIGFDRQLAAEPPDALFDDRWTFLRVFEIVLRQPSGEGKAASVVIDGQDAASVDGGKADEHIASAAVLAHVHERFLHDARDLAAGLRRQRNPIELGHELRGNPGFALESLDHVFQGVDELVGTEVARLQPLNQLAEADDLLFQKPVEASELACDARRFFDDLQAQRSQLNLHAHDRLDDAIVKFARNSRALDRRGARAQPGDPVVTASHESLRIAKWDAHSGSKFAATGPKAAQSRNSIQCSSFGELASQRRPAKTSPEKRLCRSLMEFVRGCNDFS